MDGSCPDWGCCCDHERECCGYVRGTGNSDHLGERGGCKYIDELQQDEENHKK